MDSSDCVSAKDWCIVNHSDSFYIRSSCLVMATPHLSGVSPKSICSAPRSTLGSPCSRVTGFWQITQHLSTLYTPRLIYEALANIKTAFLKESNRHQNKASFCLGLIMTEHNGARCSSASLAHQKCLNSQKLDQGFCLKACVSARKCWAKSQNWTQGQV